MRHLVLASALALSVVGCATTAANTATTAAADPMQAAATALAGQVGINPTYVTMAMTAAQALMGKGKDIPAAAGAGVDQAAAQASADGKAFTDQQKSGLLDGLTGLLGKK